MTVELREQAPVIDEVDVLVCGGGPAGIASALAAGRSGARTMLVEQHGCLGGVATSGLIGTWFGGHSRDGARPVIAGVYREIVDELVARGAALPPEHDAAGAGASSGYAPWHRATVPFEFEAAKLLFDELAGAAGVRTRLFTSVMVPRLSGSRIDGVFVHSKSGIEFIRAAVIVDATGDADVVYRAGCPMLIGLEEEGHRGWMSPGSLSFLVEGVDADAFGDYCRAGDFRFRELISALRERREWPYESPIFIAFELPDRRHFYIKVSPTTHREGFDGTNADVLTTGMTEGRRIVAEHLDILRAHFPGFAHARLVQTAPAFGVRSTRRIVGEYQVTVDDVKTGRRFDDTIALTGYHWDMATPDSAEQRMLHKVEIALPWAEIPYRCIVPTGVDNVLAPGRAISAEWDVLGPFRIMPAAFAMGEAAGIAAAMAAGSGEPVRAVDTAQLRRTLVERGAIVHIERP